MRARVYTRATIPYASRFTEKIVIIAIFEQYFILVTTSISMYVELSKYMFKVCDIILFYCISINSVKFLLVLCIYFAKNVILLQIQFQIFVTK